jgi:hypothetical protein
MNGQTFAFASGLSITISPDGAEMTMTVRGKEASHILHGKVTSSELEELAMYGAQLDEHVSGRRSRIPPPAPLPEQLPVVESTGYKYEPPLHDVVGGRNLLLPTKHKMLIDLGEDDDDEDHDDLAVAVERDAPKAFRKG